MRSIVDGHFFRAALLLLATVLMPLPVIARNESAAAIREINLSALPAEARQTIVLIKNGGPFPYARDGVVFGNYEGLLPPRRRGHYREYTVPTPGVRSRGARRIVASRDAEYYYSDDHYRSFRHIRE